MIKPYTAVGLIPTVRGIRKRADIMRNIEHLTHLVKAASWLSSLDLPVRLIAFPEGALQAFNDEVLEDRKSTRLNSSHGSISYAVFCLKKKIEYLHTNAVYVGNPIYDLASGVLDELL